MTLDQIGQKLDALRRSRLKLAIGVFFVTGAQIDFVMAAEYHYCITSSKGIGNIVVESGTVNFGKEWYKAEATKDYCLATVSSTDSGCSAVDFDQKVCGQFPQQTLTYKSVNASQIEAMFNDVGSGDPVTLGQHVVDIAVNTPATVIVKGVPQAGKAIGQGATNVAGGVAKGAEAVGHGAAAAGKAVGQGAAAAGKAVGQAAGSVGKTVGNATCHLKPWRHKC